MAADADRLNVAGMEPSPRDRLSCLRALERKVLWLSSWMIHNANHLRDTGDGLKVGGHQASSASLTTLMTALYFDVLRPQDRVAVKPHASPAFHAIQYLLGRQSRQNLERFRALGGSQSYPSRTKDSDDVDFSTGSVGLGVAMTSFASLVQDYLRLKGWTDATEPEGRMIALVGDAELDEGNVYEAMFEGWKHDIRNVWWVIDYNRQSLDAVVTDRLFGCIHPMFSNLGWDVVTLKYGKRLQAAFERPGGGALRQWIDDCPNSLYSALVFQGGGAWRRQLLADIGVETGIEELLDGHDDDALAALMTNLGGHDMETVLETFHAVDNDRPKCFIAYTIKGLGLPFAGHKDNHAGLMNPQQMAEFKRHNRIPDGAEWDRFAGLDVASQTLQAFLDAAPFAACYPRRYKAPNVAVPQDLPPAPSGTMSTQEGFGRIMADLARGGPLADRIVTTSPDVTVSTNLGGWVNRRGIFDRHTRADVFKDRKVVSAQRWVMGPDGQHIELGIAENSLFLQLAALGLSHSLFGVRLLPVGTLYDPFIQRGLDALNYACYQDARFVLVGTPSGITLAPEGGAHQSIGTPLIGMAQDGLASFEPAYVDELAAIMAWAFDYLQRDGEAGEGDWLRDARGGSVYLRLSTRPLEQPRRTMDARLREDVIQGAYWLRPPGPNCEVVIAYTGAVAAEAILAAGLAAESCRDLAVLAVTSADRLNAGWHAARRARRRGDNQLSSHIDALLSTVSRQAGIVTVTDGHPTNLSWIGAVRGNRVEPLGVEHFGQSGSIPDLYRVHGIDVDSLLRAAECVCGGRPVPDIGRLVSSSG